MCVRVLCIHVTYVRRTTKRQPAKACKRKVQLDTGTHYLVPGSPLLSQLFFIPPLSKGSNIMPQDKKSSSGKKRSKEKNARRGSNDESFTRENDKVTLDSVTCSILRESQTICKKSDVSKGPGSLRALC